jgi:nitroimidazol reductase NimA-like FMN-containing flavoprotein (pyridoxamine 5'-phosphate oxidase superfamily)
MSGPSALLREPTWWNAVGMSTTAGSRGILTPASAKVLTLSDEDCWSLLRTHKLGRLAIVIEGRPRIFPVNYAAADDTIVFRTQPGAKLEHGAGSSTCFEIDDYDQRTSMAWSVMVVGVLKDITGAGDARSRSLRSLAVEPAAPGQRLHWLALQADEVSGRSFRGGWIAPGHYLG